MFVLGCYFQQFHGFILKLVARDFGHRKCVQVSLILAHIGTLILMNPFLQMNWSIIYVVDSPHVWFVTLVISDESPLIFPKENGSTWVACGVTRNQERAGHSHLSDEIDWSTKKSQAVCGQVCGQREYVFTAWIWEQECRACDQAYMSHHVAAMDMRPIASHQANQCQSVASEWSGFRDVAGRCEDVSITLNYIQLVQQLVSWRQVLRQWHLSKMLSADLWTSLVTRRQRWLHTMLHLTWGPNPCFSMF